MKAFPIESKVVSNVAVLTWIMGKAIVFLRKLSKMAFAKATADVAAAATRRAASFSLSARAADPAPYKREKKGSDRSKAPNNN